MSIDFETSNDIRAISRCNRKGEMEVDPFFEICSDFGYTQRKCAQDDCLNYVTRPGLFDSSTQSKRKHYNFQTGLSLTCASLRLTKAVAAPAGPRSAKSE